MGNNKFKYKLKEETIKPSKVDPSLIKRIEKQYGEVDMENDFFSDNLSTYFKTDNINPNTNAISHKIIKLASFGDSLKKLSKAVKSLKSLTNTPEGGGDDKLRELSFKLKDIFNKYRTHIRKNYPDQYTQIKQQLEEISTTGGGGNSSTFNSGGGMQYQTPYAFKGKNKNKNKYLYKLVPNKIQESDLKLEQIFEAESSSEYQKKRIEAFDEIEKEINDIYKMLSNAKNETAEYYNANPGSYSVVKPTDLILDYIKDIKKLLIGE